MIKTDGYEMFRNRPFYYKKTLILGHIKEKDSL